MAIDWPDLIKTLTGQSVLLAAVAWLIKTLVSNRFTRDADAFKAQLRTEADMQIESLKNSLQMTALEHQVRFSKLHERRANVIAELYKLLIETEGIAKGFVYLENRDPIAATRARERVLELYGFVEIHRLYLPIAVCAPLDKFVAKIRHSVAFVSVYWTNVESPNPKMIQEQNEVMEAASTALETELPALRKELENEFRKLLGGAN